MNESSKELPFKHLGSHLKDLRQKLHETMSDVSGAVEIDESALANFEQGKERPTQDILQLLISHFGMQDDDAETLWRLAGYEQPRREEDAPFSDDAVGNGRTGVLVMAIDPRVIYTDSMHVNAGSSGVILSFAQTSGTPQPLITAKVGMSRDQARNVISALQAALDKTEPRQLPQGKNRNQTPENEQ
jgi:transcriptional regulator with XRE-family HTH domain